MLRPFVLSFAIFTVFLLVLGPNEMFAAEPVACQLTQDGKALQKIVVSEKASEVTAILAEEFADYLSRISEAKFEVEKGDGSSGIVLGLPEDFSALPFQVSFENTPSGREKYLLRSTSLWLYLLGATDMGVSDAVWDVLYRFGYRQFFPGETWEFIPSVTNMSIAVDEFQEPSFYLYCVS